MQLDKTVALNGPERLTRDANPQGTRKIQSNPLIIQIGEIEVLVNDEVVGSIPTVGSDKKKRFRAFFLLITDSRD